MRIERLSQQNLTVGILLVLGLISAVLSLFAGAWFRSAALASQTQSLGRVIEVATQEAISSLADQVYQFASPWQSRQGLRAALALQEHDATRLHALKMRSTSP